MIGPLSYVGGKRRVARQLSHLIPEHLTYVEPFCGGAQVFFHKAPSRIEVLNDLDGEIVNFLRICREHPEEFVRTLEFLVPSRAIFGQFAEQPVSGLTDIQRAVRFFYLQKNAFGGQVVRQTFHSSVVKPANFNPVRLPDTIRKAAERLRLVQLENSPYERVLERYDRPTTFFYLDPPYVGLSLYRHNFSARQFQDFAVKLSLLKGRFLLSINDCPEARAWFGEFSCLPISFTYTSTRSPRQFPELLFANFPLPPALPHP
jgi:DNA adenine methylase